LTPFAEKKDILVEVAACIAIGLRAGLLSALAGLIFLLRKG